MPRRKPRNWLGQPRLGDEEHPVRQSIIEDWIRCPRLYGVKRTRKALEDRGDLPPLSIHHNVKRGSLVHRLMERYLSDEELWGREPFDLGLRMSELYEVLATEDSDRAPAINPKDLAWVRRVFENYHRLVGPRPVGEFGPHGSMNDALVFGDEPWELCGVELTFGPVRWGPPNVPKLNWYWWSGTPDAVYWDPNREGYILLDFKTGSGKPGGMALDYQLQLNLYALCLERGDIPGLEAAPVIMRALVTLDDADPYKSGGKYGAAGDLKGKLFRPVRFNLDPVEVLTETYYLVSNIRRLEKRPIRFTAAPAVQCSRCFEQSLCHMIRQGGSND